MIIAKVNAGLNNVRQDVRAMREDMTKMGAQNAALSALKPLAYNPNEKAQLMAAVGHYKGDNAVALGVSVHKDENLMFNTGVSFGDGASVMVNAGVTLRIGAKAQNQVVKANVNNSNIAVDSLRKEVNDLKAENESIKAMLKELLAK